MISKRIISIITLILTLTGLFSIMSCSGTGTEISNNTTNGGIHVSRAKGYADLVSISTDSEIIAIGTVKRVINTLQEDKNFSITNFEFQTETVLKGDVSGEIVIRQAGASYRPWEVVKDDPLFQIGEKCLLFLNKNVFGTYYYYGPCSRYKITDDKVYSMNYILSEEVYKVSGELDYNGMELTTVIDMINQTLDSVRFLAVTNIRLLSGETSKIDVVLATGKFGTGMVSYTINRLDSITRGKQISMPEGMGVNIEPSEFNSLPFNDYKSAIQIKTDEQVILPGEYWILVSYNIGGTFSGQQIITVIIDNQRLSEIETRTE